MAEKEFEILTLGVDYVCESCTGGLMVAVPYQEDNMDLMAAGTYKHKCGNCGAEARLAERYPTIRHKRVAG